MKYQEIEGDLIKLAKQGEFDVIAHGANCFCIMGAGIAVQMDKAFGCNDPALFGFEAKQYQGNINKLGTIEPVPFSVDKGKHLEVINAYTQFNLGSNLDEEALTLCLRKINYAFKGKHIGLPQIGCGIAGGVWYNVKQLIRQELTDCKVTVVIYKK